MRLVGIVLVILGALGLGYQGFTYATKEKVKTDGEEVRETIHTVWIPPVASGIAVVSGLLLIAINARDATEVRHSKS